MADPIATDTLTGPPELEILMGRRAFPTAQAAFSGAPIGHPKPLNVGWYDTSVSPELGSFALVNLTAGLDLVGEIVQVAYGDRKVFAYVLQAEDLPDDTQLALTRRCFLAIARLPLSVIAANVAAVQ